MAKGDPTELPVLGGEPSERADAARNRAKVLAAARELFAKRGVQNVTVGQIAKAAGVGKGTAFHRFGDRAGLIRALVGDAERDLQETILHGPAPLGPGAPAEERLRAFLDALLDLTLENLELLIAADGAGGGRYATGAYAAWHQHVSQLVGELDPKADRVVAAEVLLAPLAPDLVSHLTRDNGVDPARLSSSVHDLVRVIARPRDDGP